MKEVPESRIVKVTKQQQFSEVPLVSTQAIREYLLRVWKQYKSADRKLKSAILDELVRNLGIHRKSATRLMNTPYPPRSLQGYEGGRKQQYSKEAKQQLKVLWQKMGYMGPVRMKASLPDWLPHYEHKDFTPRIKDELLRMSESTIRRYLAPARAELKRKMNQGTHKGLRKFITQVPIRPLGVAPSEIGHCEVDSVAHCGGSLSGTFAWTINFTDIVSGWTECVAVWGKNSTVTRKALQEIEARLPFAIKALYFDNGNEFMNEEIIDKFAKERKEPIEVFRGRPYRKNDQAYVEQKNYTHVRQLFGYGRIDWQKAVPMMNAVYRKEWRQLQNYFMPQQKLIEKQRINSKIKRKMSEAKTPYERLQPYLPQEQLKQLTKERSFLNPFQLRSTQRQKVRNIFAYFKGQITIKEWGKMVL